MIKNRPKTITYVDLGAAVFSLIVALWTIYQIWKNDKNQ